MWSTSVFNEGDRHAKSEVNKGNQFRHITEVKANKETQVNCIQKKKFDIKTPSGRYHQQRKPWCSKLKQQKENALIDICGEHLYWTKKMRPTQL